MSKICTICDTSIIPESESICLDCKRKHGIDTRNNENDGCGCD